MYLLLMQNKNSYPSIHSMKLFRYKRQKAWDRKFRSRVSSKSSTTIVQKNFPRRTAKEINPKMPESEYRLIYFDIRGFAEPLRWMFKIRGIDFVDERIPLDAWASQRKRSSGGLSIKERDPEKKRKSADNSATLLRFKRFVGQLPVLYVVDGENEVTISQTLAVMRFVASRLGFNGETELDGARADEVADLVYDLRLRAVDYEGTAFKSATPDVLRHTVFRDFASAPDSKAKDKMKEDFMTMYFPLYFTKLTSLLEQNGGEYIAGQGLTYGDLTLANFLEVVEDLVDPNCLAEFPALKALQQRIFAIPEIVEWRMAQKSSAAESGYPEEG